MKPSQFLNIGFRPFAMIASAKQLVATTLLASMLFFAPSLRADIIYDVAQTITSVSYPPYPPYTYYDGGFQTLYAGESFGNSFSTTLSNTNIKSISVYLYKDGSTTGLATLGIYETNSTSGGYVIKPGGSRLASATYNIANITTNNISGGDYENPTGNQIYTFQFTGANAISLEANKHYAFLLETSGVGIYFNNTNSTSENAIYKNSGSNEAINFQSVAGQVEVETTAVPEPGTLILTGSALLAGAIGVYFTRRHRDQALTPASV